MHDISLCCVESGVTRAQKIAQTLLHDFATRCGSGVESVAMALGAGAVPVDADHEAVAQWNRGALPVAGWATECAWLRWYWHEETSLARYGRYSAPGARQIVSLLSRL